MSDKTVEPVVVKQEPEPQEDVPSLHSPETRQVDAGPLGLLLPVKLEPDTDDFIKQEIDIGPTVLYKPLSFPAPHESSRPRVTYSQLQQMYEFLSVRREIAIGYNKTSHAREFSRRMWEEIALALNSNGDGAIKDWKGWNKFWNDYKSKLKKAVAANRSSQQQTGGGPSTSKPLTNLEKKFLQILINNFGSGLPGKRVEPFEQETVEASSQLTVAGSDVDVHAVPLSPPELTSPHVIPAITPPIFPQKTPLPIPDTTPRPITPIHPLPATEQQATPRLTPRRRRRRERPTTAEAARRVLIRESERQAVLEERRAVAEERRAATEERRAAIEERRAATEERRAATEERRTAIEERRAAIKERLVEYIREIRDVIQRSTAAHPTDVE